MPPDAAIDSHKYYAIDRMYLVSDSDTPPSDPVGYLFSLLGVLGPDVQHLTDHAIDTGAAINLIDVQTSALTGKAQLQVFGGGHDPVPAACASADDATCRHHLQGNAVFQAFDPAGVSAAGDAASANWSAQGGSFLIQLPVLGDNPAAVTLHDAKVAGDISGAQIKQLAVTAAVSAQELDALLIPALSQNLTALIAHDCTALTAPPVCGCTDSSTGQVLLNTFDADQDCKLTIDEIRTNFLLAVLSPDVEVDGQPAYSVAFTLDAVPAGVNFDKSL